MNNENQTEQASVSVGRDVKDGVAVAGHDNITNVTMNITQSPEKPDAPKPDDSRFLFPNYIIVLALIGLSVWWGFSIQNKLKPFKENTFGVLIAPLKVNADDKHQEKSKAWCGIIRSTLNARFDKSNVRDTEVKEIPIDMIPFLKSHEQARDFGKKYNAELIIWGDVNKTEGVNRIIPQLTIVKKSSDASFIVKSEMTVFKESLAFSSSAQPIDMSLTDEPAMIASFVTGLKYFREKNYEEAIKYFTESLPKEATDAIKTYNILLYRGLSYSYLTSYLTNRYDYAISDYSKAIDINPKLDKAYNNRGVVYSNKSEYDKAIEDFNQAISLKPENDAAYNNRGLAYLDKGQYQKAIEDFNQAISVNPKLAEPYNNIGIFYRNEDEYDNAIKNYDKAIEINPKFDKAYNNRGVACSSKGEYDKAIQDYNQAISLNPKYAEAYNNRGAVYTNKIEYDKAIKDFNHSISLNPKYVDAYSNLGVVYHNKDEYDKAMENYNKAIEINPRFDKAYNNRGFTYYKKGEYDKAIEDYNQAIEINTKFVQAYINRGLAYARKSAYDKAIEDYNQAISLNPKQIDICHNLGNAYSDKGEYEKAIENYNKAIDKINPNDLFKIYNNRGIAYDRKGEYEKAIEDYNQALNLNSKDYYACSNRGIAYVHKGEYDKAIEDYNQAISLNPKYADAYNNRGNAYNNKGEYEKAVGDYTQAISLNPKYDLAYRNIAWFLATCPDEKYRNGGKAIEFAQKALESEPNSPQFLDTLAAAYAEAGKFEDAVKTQEKAIEMLNEKDKDKSLSEYTEHLNFYKANKPWREKKEPK